MKLLDFAARADAPRGDVLQPLPDDVIHRRAQQRIVLICGGALYLSIAAFLIFL